MAETNFSRIELLVLDVDGVMTDGRIIITPAGEEIKEFHVRDGSGMKYWQRAGHKLAIITGRASPAVTRRASDLGVDVVRLGAKEKLPVYLDVLRELKLSPLQAAVIGDDLTDLPLLRNCGFPVAVADAAEETKQAAAYVTKLAGGHGCVRETLELILKRRGQWQGIVDGYLSQRPASQEN